MVSCNVSTGTLTSFDLELLRWFASDTGATVITGRPDVCAIFQVALPAIAVEHDFMMNTLLGTACLHISHLMPHDRGYANRALELRTRALGGMQRALANLKADDHKAVLATAILFTVLSSGEISDPFDPEGNGQLWITTYLGLIAGIRHTVRTVGWEVVKSTGLEPLFIADFNRPPPLPTPKPLKELLKRMDPQDPFYEPMEEMIDYLNPLFNYLRINGVDSYLNLRILTWTPSIRVDELYEEMKQKRPEALVLIAYYLMFFKLMEPNIWWLIGIPDREIVSISKMLPEDWRLFMAAPLQCVLLTERKEIKSLLLSLLPTIEESFEDPMHVDGELHGSILEEIDAVTLEDCFATVKGRRASSALYGHPYHAPPWAPGVGI